MGGSSGEHGLICLGVTGLGFMERLGGCAVADAAVGMFLVVVPSVVFDDHTGFSHAEHEFPVQALVAPRAVARGVAQIAPRTWTFLVLSGLATGLSWLCYFRALQLGEASQVAPVDKLSVVFTIALAAIFLGERLSWHQWVSGGFILAGAVGIALKPA